LSNSVTRQSVYGCDFFFSWTIHFRESKNLFFPSVDTNQAFTIVTIL
jgi:hypothetical protein